jgi:DNA repair photolyase
VAAGENEMPLAKATGNMYPWVTHMHAELGGECEHKCKYCYVDNPRWGRAPRYCGEVRLIDKETKVHLGSGNVIFKEHMNDLFAEHVPAAMIQMILDHCQKWPDNTYVFQSKNPGRFQDFNFPESKLIFGTTIETNRDISESISRAPQTFSRMKAICADNMKAVDKFVTIEPVMDFDVDVLASWIDRIRPKFLNLGADSKNHNLPEPTVEKIMALVDKLKEYGIELREKHNLARLKP